MDEETLKMSFIQVFEGIVILIEHKGGPSNLPNCLKGLHM